MQWNISYWICSINRLCWQSETNTLIMKWSSYYIVLFFSIILSSDSDNAGDKETGTNTAAESAGNTPAIASVAKEKRSDIAAKGLKGKVKVLSEATYFTDMVKRKLSSKTVFKYDKDGNRIELANYRPDGKINSTVKSVYDANGNLTNEQTTLADGKLDVNSTIKTDAKGNKIEQEDIRPGGDVLFNYKYQYHYDEKGQLIEHIAYRGNGSFLFKYDFKYDDKGNKTEWIQTSSDSTVV